MLFACQNANDRGMMIVCTEECLCYYEYAMDDSVRGGGAVTSTIQAKTD